MNVTIGPTQALSSARRTYRLPCIRTRSSPVVEWYTIELQSRVKNTDTDIDADEAAVTDEAVDVDTGETDTEADAAAATQGERPL